MIYICIYIYVYIYMIHIYIYIYDVYIYIYLSAIFNQLISLADTMTLPPALHSKPENQKNISISTGRHVKNTQYPYMISQH